MVRERERKGERDTVPTMYQVSMNLRCLVDMSLG